MILNLSPQVIAISISFMMLALAIMAHAVASIWWASKITTTVAYILDTLKQINDEFKKRDENMARMWHRIDELRDMITTK